MKHIPPKHSDSLFTVFSNGGVLFHWFIPWLPLSDSPPLLVGYPPTEAMIGGEFHLCKFSVISNHIHPLSALFDNIVTDLSGGNVLPLYPGSSASQCSPPVCHVSYLVIGSTDFWLDHCSPHPPSPSFLSPTLLPCLKHLIYWVVYPCTCQGYSPVLTEH